MENENENFDQLKKLLALKKHELPPPGYFNKLPAEVVSRIRAGRNATQQSGMATLNAEAPWLMRLWQSLEAKPLFAGAFGAVVCALMLGAILFSEKPPTQPTFAGPRNADPSSLAGTALAGTAESGGVGKPLFIATNQAPPNLFDLIQNGQNATAPVSFTP